MSGDVISTDLISNGLKKDFNCRKNLNSILNNKLASDILNKLIEYHHSHKIISPTYHMDSENSSKPLSLQDFKGLFLLFHRIFLISDKIVFVIICT